MQKLKTFLITIATLGLVLPMAPITPAQAQYAPLFVVDAPQGVGNSLGAVSTDVGILIKYVGTSPAGGVVTVAAATGDITLETGVVSGATADATTECPVSGALGGIIDVSDAACNTLGEVVDAINASPNWKAVIVDGLRSDTSVNTLNTLAATSAATAKGIPLLKDTTVALNTTIALIPYEMRTDIRPWLNKQGTALHPNPFADSQTFFQYASETFTGTGADTYSISSVRVSNSPNGPAAASTAASILSTSTETVTPLFSKTGGGTTVETVFNFANTPIVGRRQEKLIARLTAGTTYTAATHSATGITGTYRKSQ